MAGARIGMYSLPDTRQPNAHDRFERFGAQTFGYVGRHILRWSTVAIGVEVAGHLLGYLLAHGVRVGNDRPGAEGGAAEQNGSVNEC